MTTPGLFYYPQGAPLKKISLTQELSELTESEERDEVVHETISGRQTHVVFSSRVTVRVVSELVTDQTDAADLEVLCNHLRRGGTIAVAESVTRTLGAFLRIAPERGATSINWYPNLFENFGGSFTPTEGEVFYLRGPSPKGLKEYVVAGATSTTRTTTLSTVPKHDWTREPWVFLHNKRFWPFLRLKPEAVNDQLIRSTRRIYYTLDLPLEEIPWALSRVSQAPTDPLLGEVEEHGVGGFPDPGELTGRTAPDATIGSSYRPPNGSWWRP